jgi:hypothetical protein
MATAASASRLLSRPEAQTDKPGPMQRMLKHLGLWSYSLYLLHLPLLTIYWWMLPSFFPSQFDRGPLLFLLMSSAMLALIPFCVLFYKVFELPSIALGKWIVNREARTAVRPSAIALSAFVLCATGILLMSARFSLRVAAEKNNRAWTLATSPESTHRDGLLAVKLAEDACRQTRFENPQMIGTLAAAYAEAGRFDEAISAAQKACALASQSGDEQLVQRNQQLLSMYHKHQAYHEPQEEKGR